MTEYDLAIVGAGVAGLSAGTYAGRGGLKVIILDEGTAGGVANNAPVVENFPGFESIAGHELVGRMRAQTARYAEIRELVQVKSVTGAGPFVLELEGGSVAARAVVIATGAKYKPLGLQSEFRLAGKGVSYCATCDGFFFKGKKVFLVGGGNSALCEALHLHKTGVDVTLVHRRSELRAEKQLQDAYFQAGGKAILGTVVEDILGESVVTGIRLRKTEGGPSEDYQCSGVFVAIGFEPNNSLAKQLGVALKDDGSVLVDGHQRTSARYVYAAGDITPGIKQMVTAAAQGATAALAAFEDLTTPYWKK
ncbi:MAG: FAD-dependent oxidoreductase [Methanobacteriota archaeon]